MRNTCLKAIAIVLWDLHAEAGGATLRKLPGVATSWKLVAYNTDISWLSIPKPELVDGCKRAVEKEGFRCIKLKVGHANPAVDIDRLEAVRQAVGPNIAIAAEK